MTDLVKTITDVFPKKRIVVAGDLVADQFLHGAITRVSREAPVFILKHEETETRPGGAANAAANIASLGGTPLPIGVIGDDENGHRLRESLIDHSVGCGSVADNFAGVTTTKVRVLAGHNYAVKQQVIRIDYENPTPYSKEIESELIENLRLAIDEADAAIISDYGYGVVRADLYEEAQALAKKAGIPLIVDSRFRLKEFPGATSATPNQEEVEQLLGADFTDADCARLCEDLGYESLIVTCGNRGMIIVEPGRGIYRMPAIGSTQPVDVTGAGDTVIAAYALGLASGLNFREAATIANHAGGIVVMKKGTATVSATELIESITNEDLLVHSDFAV
ncbi:MAG TPA: PfkB family carbohydrate kinase [Pyrinomonadaceae bacterium]|jgi:D-glycero-beta-D-manno-heptose-7-phosphate kinase|nr:PfkB family carbohydrate kinase [Pyrinomonadaceae bacterium]